MTVTPAGAADPIPATHITRAPARTSKFNVPPFSRAGMSCRLSVTPSSTVTVVAPPVAFTAASVCDTVPDPDFSNSSVAPAATVTQDDDAIEPAAPTASVPALTVVVPPKVFTAASRHSPESVFARLRSEGSLKPAPSTVFSVASCAVPFERVSAVATESPYCTISDATVQGPVPP